MDTFLFTFRVNQCYIKATFSWNKKHESTGEMLKLFYQVKVIVFFPACFFIRLDTTATNFMSIR